MSSGHGGEAAPVSVVVRLLQREAGLRAALERYPIISRQFLVPYGAGKARDGGMTYISEQIPERFKMGVEVDKYANAHETAEWWLMTRLGMLYWKGGRGAHWLASGIENFMLKCDGWSDDDIEAYEVEWDTYIGEDEHARLSPENVPPDLYLGPYEGAAEDDDPREDKLDERILPILRAAAAASAMRMVMPA